MNYRINASDLNTIPEDLISKVPNIDFKTPISEVLPLLNKNEAVIVNKNNRFYGVLDTRAIKRSKLTLNLPRRMTAGKFAVKTQSIDDGTSIYEAIENFNKAGAKALPYVVRGSVLGLLERSTMLKMILSTGLAKETKVRDAMTSPLLSMNLNSTMGQARALMLKYKVNRLAITDSYGRFIGLVTHSDIITRYTKASERMPEKKINMTGPAELPITDAILSNPITVDQEKSIPEAIRLLVENKISSLIVTKKGVPTGMLTISDIFQSITASKAVELNNVYISSLDPSLYEYKEEITEAANAFINKIKKLHGIKVNYLILRIKRIKTSQYEVHARLALGRSMMQVSVTDYMLEKTLNRLFEILKGNIIKIKEKRLSAEWNTSRRRNDSVRNKKTSKAQSSLELLVTLSFGLIILLPIVVLAFVQISTSQSTLTSAEAQQAASKLASVAAAVGVQGYPAKQLTLIQVPPNVYNIEIGTQTNGVGHEIIFIVRTSSGLSYVTAYTPVNVSGNIAGLVSTGTYLVNVSAQNSCPSSPGVSCVYIAPT